MTPHPHGGRLAALAVAAALTAGVAGPALAAETPPSTAADVHPYYARMLQEGTYAHERGEHAAAARDLRLAAFGLLGQPPLLASTLVRLTLAQAALERQQDAAETARRVLLLEERFGAYAGSGLPAATRRAFESALVELLPRNLLREQASFRHLAAPQAAVPPAGAPSGTPSAPPVVVERRPPQGAAPSAAPSAAPVVVERRPPESAVPPTAPAPAGSRPAAPAGAASTNGAGSSTPLPPGAQRQLDEVRQALAEARRAADLGEALRDARAVADAYPGSREASRLAGEIAYRASRWEDAVRYLRRTGEPAEDQPNLLFYLAVSLYETGDRQAAAEVLQKALPRLSSTPFVDSYRRKILEDGPR